MRQQHLIVQLRVVDHEWLDEEENSLLGQLTLAHFRQLLDVEVTDVHDETLWTLVRLKDCLCEGVGERFDALILPFGIFQREQHLTKDTSNQLQARRLATKFAR